MNQILDAAADEMCQTLWNMSADAVSDSRLCFMFYENLIALSKVGRLLTPSEKQKFGELPYIPSRTAVALRKAGVLRGSHRKQPLVNLERLNELVNLPCVVGCRDAG